MGVGVGDGGAGVDVGEGVGATVGDDGVSVDSDDGELLSFPHAIRAKAWLTNKADNNSQDSNDRRYRIASARAGAIHSAMVNEVCNVFCD